MRATFDIGFSAPRRGAWRFAGRLAEIGLRRMLAGVTVGRLALTLPDGTKIDVRGAQDGPIAQLTILRWWALGRLLAGGDLAFAESYMRGEWETPDLVSLLMFGGMNTACAFERKRWFVRQRLERAIHRRQRNTRAQAPRNIRAHYDLGNDFYAHWLDQGMSYSSALYTTPDMTLEAAQTAKQARALELLAPPPGARVLEIGCGWGGLAQFLARAGHHVTGLTLSPAQQDYAQKLLGAGGQDAACDIRLQDYRDVDGQFDAIVSIEMFEAVGEEYWPAFFRTLAARLRPGGCALLQIITIAEDRFESYRATPDFIQMHIFPGGMLPSIPALRQQIAAAGLIVDHEERFGLSYARTLSVWSERFEAAWPQLSDRFDARFRQKWRYYLAYCEAGFRTGALDVGFYRVIAPMEASA